MESVAVNIVAREMQVSRPWISQLSREFGVNVILSKAQVEKDFGRYLIVLEGATEEIQRATAWLMTTGMHVEALTRALVAD